MIMAMKMGAPVIGLDRLCGYFDFRKQRMRSMHLELCTMKQTLASGVIPQITAVFGTCGGGLAVIAGSVQTLRLWRTETGKIICEFSKCTGRKC